MFPLRTILHPTDFSPRSEGARRLALSLARDHGARLLVLHVVRPPAVLYGEAISILAEGAEKEVGWKALRDLPWPDTTVAVDLSLKEGDPAAEIVRLAQEAPADLIVMGTHGRSGLGRLLMGSVAEQVVRKAPCPVVTMKTPLETSAGEAPGTATADEAVGVEKG
jgi:nucleotide-binding universal stress UspA family protein